MVFFPSRVASGSTAEGLFFLQLLAASATKASNKWHAKAFFIVKVLVNVIY